MDKRKGRMAGINLSVGLEGGLAFRMHRFTGLALAVYLFLHVLWVFVATVFPGAAALLGGIQAAIAARLVEVLLLFCACFHGLNGLRITLFDLVLPQRWEVVSSRSAFTVVLLAAVLVWLPAAAWLFARLPAMAGGG